MKRHDSLIPLTHDHHHALVKARRMILASESTDPRELLEASGEFLRFFRDDTLQHFHEEEEVVFPLLLEEEAEEPPEELIRVLIDHVRIHGLVEKLRSQVASEDVAPELARTIGETLRAHVRLEETKLFPLIEQRVSEGALRSVHLAERDRSTED